MKPLFFILILVALLLTLGCIEDNNTITPPFTTNQFVRQATDLNYTLWKAGDYNNMVLVFDGNKISVADANTLDIALPDLSGFVPYTGATSNVGLGDFNLSADCVELGDGNTYCSAGDFPNPDLSEYARLDGASFTGDVNVVGNISASNSINWGYGQANLKNSYMNLPIRSSDWNTEVHFFDAEFLPKYTSGTITQWDVMNSQKKSMSTVISCRTATTANSICILAFMGRNPATSGFYYNSTIGSARHTKNFVTRVKFWDINAKIVIGSFASGELSATLANYWTKGDGVNFLSQIDEQGNGTWGFRCGNSNSINDSGVSIDNNKWYVLRITGNQDYGYGLGATSFDFYVDENRIGTCTPANYANNNGLFYSMIGFVTQNTTATTTLGADIIVVDWVYVEENRWDYDDLYKFTGGRSSP